MLLYMFSVMNTQTIFNLYKEWTNRSLRQIWAFRVHDIMLYTGESKTNAQHSLERLTKNGILLRLGGGFYTINLPQCIPTYAGVDMARGLRPLQITWFSLESRLSELGIISQIPAVGTFMTTGRRGRFKTAVGTIEYTHTSGRVSPEDIYWDEERRTWVATPKRALEDLKKTGRNLGLVDMNIFKEVQTEFFKDGKNAKIN
jgi:predicted transcriptional regulator of viral defense system